MPVRYEVHQRIATVMLDRPEAMNSLDPESLVELNEAFQLANGDQDVRVVILTGAGDKAFCTGSDLKKTMPPKESFAELTFGRPKWLYPFWTPMEGPVPTPIDSQGGRASSRRIRLVARGAALGRRIRATRAGRGSRTVA